MSEQLTSLEALRADVLAGRLDRRSVLKRAMALGVSAPVIGGLLAACGGDDDTGGGEATSPAATAAATSGAGTGSAATPTTGGPAATSPAASPTASGSPAATTATGGTTPGQGRGAGDLLRLLYWQAATNLNPHFSQGNNNSAPAALVLEPLVLVDAAGEIVPVLVEQAPSLENGGISEDGRTIEYTLLEGLVWSDGEPFTSEDARFTWEWVTDPAASATSISAFLNIEDVEIVDERTFRVKLKEPDPAWYNPFSRGTSLGGQIVPKHILEDHTGEQAATAPFNLAPIGTGPFKIVEFVPGDVVTYEINENYRDPDKPYFQRVEFKGGGDATGAARAIFQSGEADYALNLQVEKTVLEDLMADGLGDLVVLPTGNVEQIFINFSDPNKEVNGGRSEPSTQHPFLTDKAVRQALALGCDRESIATQLYGPSGEATANVITAPENFVSPNTSFTFDVEEAGRVLDEAGWMMDGGMRAKDGVQTRVLYQTTINPLRQKTQEIIKQAWEQIGIGTELKSIDASVYFSSDAGNPDTWLHFYADVQMATLTGRPYPIDLMEYWKSTNPDKDLAQKSNGYTGPNINRWVNKEYSELWEQARTELDPARQAELFIAMNDLVVDEIVNIALISRARVDGAAKKLKGYIPSPWSDETYDIANWHFEE